MDEPTEDTIRLEGQARIFGQRPTPATVTVRNRPEGQRILRTALALLATLIVTPAAFLVPPHAPWGIGALIGGLLVTRRQWAHTRSVLDLEAICPECGNPLSVATGSRLASPHPLSCESCQRGVTIHVDH